MKLYKRSISNSKREFIIKRDRCTCKICNKIASFVYLYSPFTLNYDKKLISPIDNNGDRFHIDHIKPLSKWWNNEIKNLQLLCQRCNLKKYNFNW